MTTPKTAAKKGSAAKKAPAKKAAPAAAKKAAPAAAKKAAPAAAKKVAGNGVAKATPVRSVTKESPLKGMPLGDWVKAKASGWQVGAIERLIKIVRAAAPEASATIKWGQPVFESNGPFAFIRPAKAHVTFGFWRGTEIVDPKKLLEGTGDRMAHIKIRSADAIDEAALSAMIKDAVRLNQEKGSPTIRG